VVINTNRPVGTYWVSLRALGDCEGGGIYQEALLRYEGASYHGVLVSNSPGQEGLPEGRVSGNFKKQCPLRSLEIKIAFEAKTNLVCAVSKIDGSAIRRWSILIYSVGGAADKS
jgi:hypothetical protein